MSSLTQLKAECTTVLAISNKTLTSLAISGGYNSLYSLKDSSMRDRVLLYLYVTALQIWFSFDASPEILCEDAVRKLLIRIRGIYPDYDCEVDETPVDVTDASIFGGSFVLVPGSGTITNITTTTTATPPAIRVTGDQLIDNSYTNSIYAGYDLLIFLNGMKYLKKDIDYAVKEEGGFDILLTGIYANEDEFYMIPNGLLYELP